MYQDVRSNPADRYFRVLFFKLIEKRLYAILAPGIGEVLLFYARRSFANRNRMIWQAAIRGYRGQVHDRFDTSVSGGLEYVLATFDIDRSELVRRSPTGHHERAMHQGIATGEVTRKVLISDVGYNRLQLCRSRERRNQVNGNDAVYVIVGGQPS
jgi:hypothetical protein